MELDKDFLQFAYKAVLIACVLLAVLLLTIITHDIRQFVNSYEPTNITVQAPSDQAVPDQPQQKIDPFKNGQSI